MGNPNCLSAALGRGKRKCGRNPCACERDLCASKRGSSFRYHPCLFRHCEERSGEAIQLSAMDCFASLAMTVQLSARLAEQLVDIVPVDEVIDERLQVIRTAVAIVDVVGM